MENLKLFLIIFIIFIISLIIKQLYNLNKSKMEFFEETTSNNINMENNTNIKVNTIENNSNELGMQIGTVKSSGIFNKWIFNTPDDGSQLLNIASRKNDDSGWNYDNKTVIDNSGNLMVNGTIQSKGTMPIQFGVEKTNLKPSNKWAFMTPDDKSHTLNIIPRENDDSAWNLSKKTIFDNSGNITTNGDIIVQGQNIEIGVKQGSQILNKWLIQTPTNGSQGLFFIPRTSDDLKWDKDKEMILEPNGNLTINGNLTVTGDINGSASINLKGDITSSNGNLNLTGSGQGTGPGNIIMGGDLTIGNVGAANTTQNSQYILGVRPNGSSTRLNVNSGPIIGTSTAWFFDGKQQLFGNSLSKKTL